MPTLLASALVAGFFILSGAHGVSATDASAAVNLPSYTVSMTSYNAVASQTDGDPMTTASGLRSNSDIIAARSQDLKQELPFGTVIAVEAPDTDTFKCRMNAVNHLIGYRVIGDTMNARMHNRVDILLDQHDTVKLNGVSMNPSRVLGVCAAVTVRVIGYMDLSDVPKTQEELVRMVEGVNKVALK
jgi:3D (Asp-Asp-Asp) domain-containing protein